MPDIEEKIKAFLSDKEKVKALANDEKFIEKVSGGMANTETYSEEFKKLGLELSSEELKEIEQSVTKIMSSPVEKLADVSLEHVSGGSYLTEQQKQTLGHIWFGISAVGLIGATGCSIAGIVFSSKASKAIQKGDEENAKKYTKAANNLAIAATSIGGIGIAGLIVPPAVAGAGGKQS